MKGAQSSRGILRKAYATIQDWMLYYAPSTEAQMLEREAKKENTIGSLNKRLLTTPFKFLVAVDKEGRADDDLLPVYKKILKTIVGMRYSPMSYSIPRILNFATSKNLWLAIGVTCAVITIINPPALLVGGALGTGIAVTFAACTIAVNVYNTYEETRRVKKASSETEQMVLLEKIAKLKGVDLSSGVASDDGPSPKLPKLKIAKIVAKQTLILAANSLSFRQISPLHSILHVTMFLFNLRANVASDIAHHQEKLHQRAKMKQHQEKLGLDPDLNLQDLRSLYHKQLGESVGQSVKPPPERDVGWWRSFVTVVRTGFSSSASLSSKMRCNPKEARAARGFYDDYEREVRKSADVQTMAVSEARDKSVSIAREQGDTIIDTPTGEALGSADSCVAQGVSASQGVQIIGGAHHRAQTSAGALTEGSALPAQDVHDASQQVLTERSIDRAPKEQPFQPIILSMCKALKRAGISEANAQILSEAFFEELPDKNKAFLVAHPKHVDSLLHKIASDAAEIAQHDQSHIESYAVHLAQNYESFLEKHRIECAEHVPVH